MAPNNKYNDTNVMFLMFKKRRKKKDHFHKINLCFNYKTNVVHLGRRPLLQKEDH